MPNQELHAYIVSRLEAGESPTRIAATLHAWGYTVGTDRAQSQLAPSTNISPARTPVLPIILNVSLFFVLGLGAVGYYHFRIAAPQAETIAQAVVAPEFQDESQEREPAVLSAQITSETTDEHTDTIQTEPEFAPEQPIANPTPTPTTTPAPTVLPLGQDVSKSDYKIALVGDSMIDTLDSHLPELAEKMSVRYDAEFTIYNYGVGAQNAEMGLKRFSQPLSSDERNYPALTELQPDVIIIGSFAYNPFSAHDVNKYWITMAQIVDAAKATGADVYLLAEIAPMREKFAVGSLEWTVDYRAEHAQKIVDQLNSFVALSESLNVPLIDVYARSKTHGNFGSGAYTNSSDGIHANNTGKTLTINEIVKNIEIQ